MEIRRRNWCNNFFIAENQQKTILNFSLDLLNVTEQYIQWNINK